MSLTFSILNLFNEVYISDAQNNDTYNAISSDFDAKSAGVFFGLGRTCQQNLRFKQLKKYEKDNIIYSIGVFNICNFLSGNLANELEFFNC